MASFSFIAGLVSSIACVYCAPSYFELKDEEVAVKGIHDEYFTNEHPRSLYQFYQMISCATTNNPLKYNSYGCYCGLGGTGTPVDSLDRCCERHDACYKQINRDKRCRFPWYIYVKSYERKGCTGCASSNDDCETAICKCDSVAAECFAKTKLDPNYEDYPQSKCK